MDVNKKDDAIATRCRVSTFGLRGQARLRFDGLCADTDSLFAFGWAADSVSELMRLASSATPDLLVFDYVSLGDRAPFVLAELRAVSQRIRSLLIGEPTDPRLIGRLVPFGLRGVVPGARLETDFQRALEALMQGQMWFSRRQMAELLNDRVSDHAARRSDTFRNIHELTDREFTVMHGILKGSTNKDIARSLRISEQTVKIHVQNIFRKLRVNRRIDLLLMHEAARH